MIMLRQAVSSCSLPFALTLLALILGCGDTPTAGPADDEISAYLDENPDAAKNYDDVELEGGDTAN